jgi:hypothetical protein
MQTIIQATIKSDVSLRNAITNDDKCLEDNYNIKVESSKKRDRTKGWANLKSTRGSGYGALKLSWDPNTKTLTGRVINRGKGKPDDIVGDFCAYLLFRYAKRLRFIQIFQA